MRPWHSLLQNIRSYDWFLIIIVCVLSAIGLSAIYSVDLSHGGPLLYVPVQIIALSIGLGLVFFGGALHRSVYQSFARILYIVSVLLLVLVLFLGTSIRGTLGWFRLGSFSFQPAEFAKVALILSLALTISRMGRRFDRLRYVFATGFLMAVLAALIMFQPDLGSASVLVGIWMGILFFTVQKKHYLLALFSIFAVIAVVGWLFFLKPYQKDRVLTFINPTRDPLGSGYNVSQSIIAIGAGNLVGRGLGFGSQSQLRFLPEAQTDFIFSVIAEELGFVGTMLVIGLYGLLIWRLTTIALHCDDDFAAYTVLGIALFFFFQMVLNIGAATGLLPVTGVTLPFVSYGGSSLVVNFLLIAIAESMARSART